MGCSPCINTRHHTYRKGGFSFQEFYMYLGQGNNLLQRVMRVLESRYATGVLRAQSGGQTHR